MLEQAPKDFLTGFFLRDSLGGFLQNLITESKLKKKIFSIALIDLDHFKKFNDKFGHAFGDEVLKYATSTLRLTFHNEQCYFFRFGGDEFIAVFPDRHSEEIFRLFKRCNYNMSHRYFLYANKLYKATISCGIAAFPSDGDTQEKLLERIDKAMYFSKRHGRNRTTLAGRIKYLKACRAFIMFTCIAIAFFAIFILYPSLSSKILEPSAEHIMGFKVFERRGKPKNLDMLVLNNGFVFEGRILAETNDKVILNLYFKQGEGSVTFNRSEIAKIKYGSLTPLE
ncbi:MAG: GGDEF domain-containing protein [Candidatus Omnitrophota bacterium]